MLQNYFNELYVRYIQTVQIRTLRGLIETNRYPFCPVMNR